MEACRLSGVTFRQLDYWVRRSSVTPERGAVGSGSRRVWSALDVDRLLVLARLSGLLGDMPADLCAVVWTWLGAHEVWPQVLEAARDRHHRWSCHAGAGQAGLWVSLLGTGRARPDADVDGIQLHLQLAL
jgi:hypothetical protein